MGHVHYRSHFIRRADYYHGNAADKKASGKNGKDEKPRCRFVYLFHILTSVGNFIRYIL